VFALLTSPVRRDSRPVALLASLLLGLTACDKGSAAPAEPQEQPQTSTAPDSKAAPGPSAHLELENSAAEDPASTVASTPGEGSSPTEPATAEPATAEPTGATEPTEPAEPAEPRPAEPTKPAAKPKTKPGLPAPLFGGGNTSCGRDPGVGQPIKSFSLETTTGKTISSGSLKGRVILLNFWGTWCKPCLKELPEFDRLYRRYRKNGLVLLAIATDSDPEPVKALAKERRLAAKIAVGGEELANSYKSPSFPFSFVVDENGIIQASYRGFKPECLGQLEQDIRKQLAAE